MTGPFLLDTSRSPHASLRPVPVSAVTLEGEFWGRRLRTLAEVTLPDQHRLLEETGVLDNFRRAAGQAGGSFRGLEFADTDLYKWLEAACWVLAGAPHPELRGQVEEAVAVVERAQEPDGYLDTFHARDPGARWTNLRSHHELYCVGHLLQAALVHHRVTGSDRLLRVARRAADLVCSEFGAAGGGRRGIDGHPGVELALVELYRETREARYLELARTFLEARGHGLLAGGRLGTEYYLDHAPLRELERLTGHAVRALYYVSGAADVYMELGDGSLLRTLERLWTRMVRRQLYVSGGLGSRPDTESLGGELELPNARACCETCAAVAGVMWCQRMLAATGEARYADLIEWTLFNAVLPGWSQDGTAYFYENPLQDGGGRRRQRWHECACCPPNLARLLASLPGLAYGIRGDALFVNLYGQSQTRIDLAGRSVGIAQRTRYPWEGLVELTVEGEGEFAVDLRIPAWSGPGVVLEVNGVPVDAVPAPGAFAEIRRRWRPGDRVSLQLPMPVRALRSHPGILENTGRIALARGPILYCLEGVDHPGVDLPQVTLGSAPRFRSEWRPEHLGGLVVIRASGEEHASHPAWAERLYAPVEEIPPGSSRPVELEAVPYHAWANRAPGPMQIWIGQRVRAR